MTSLNLVYHNTNSRIEARTVYFVKIDKMLVHVCPQLLRSMLKTKCVLMNGEKRNVENLYSERETAVESEEAPVVTCV